MEDKQLPKTIKPVRGVTHHLAHRTRYRLAHKHRDVKTLKRIHESMAKVPGVKQIELNDRTGSILVHHEESANMLPLLETVFDDLGLELLEGCASEEIAIISGLSVIANLVKSRFAVANQSVAQATNNTLDLKTLVPMLFLGGGIVQASNNSGWWKQIPAWALFYYAFDSYLKFHGAGNYNQVPANGNGHNNLQS